MVTKETIAEIRATLEAAERDYAAQKLELQREVLTLLESKAKELNAEVAELEKLARSAGLVFYYSSGYETFEVVDEDNWSESSKYC